jgi:death on curing protein
VALLFLTLDEVLAILGHQIARYGGALGVRDQGLLESALAMPAATFAGEYDGNKRVGLACSLVFLRLNGIHVRASDDDLVDLVMGVAEGPCSKADVAVFLRERSTQSAKPD